ANGIVVLGPVEPPHRHPIEPRLTLHAFAERLQPGQYRLDRIGAWLRPLPGRHGLFPQHSLHPVQDGRSLAEAPIVLELIQPDVATGLPVAVAFKTVFGQEGQDGLLKARPVAGRFGRLTSGVGGDGQRKHTPAQTEDSPSRHRYPPGGIKWDLLYPNRINPSRSGRQALGGEVKGYQERSFERRWSPCEPPCRGSSSCCGRPAFS